MLIEERAVKERAVEGVEVCPVLEVLLEIRDMERASESFLLWLGARLGMMGASTPGMLVREDVPK